MDSGKPQNDGYAWTLCAIFGCYIGLFMIEPDFEYPSIEEFNEIANSFNPINELEFNISLNQNSFNDFFENLIAKTEFPFWIIRFNNKLRKIRISYIISKFHFLKGIPDDEWFITPGKNGGTVEYFQHFDKFHHFNKFMFSYYYEMFYYHFLSSVDVLYHILNIFLNLKIDYKKCIKQHKSFTKAVLKKIEKIGRAHV
jgi:hypothetical protein